MFVKATEVQDGVRSARIREPENEFLDKIHEKAEQVKKEIENGNTKNAIPHLVKDLSKAKEKLQEDILIPNSEKAEPGLIPLVEVEVIGKRINSLESQASRYNDVRQKVKDALMDIIKNTEVILGIEKNKKDGDSVANKDSRAPSAVSQPFGYSSKGSKDSMGRIVEVENEEDDDRGVRRRRVKKSNTFLMSHLEDESKEGYSFKPFTEGSEAQKLIGDFQRTREDNDRMKRRIGERDYDDELNIDDANGPETDRHGSYSKEEKEPNSKMYQSETDKPNNHRKSELLNKRQSVINSNPNDRDNKIHDNEDVHLNKKKKPSIHPYNDDKIKNLDLEYESNQQNRDKDGKKSLRDDETLKKFAVQNYDVVDGKDIGKIEEIELVVLKKDGADTPESLKSHKDNFDPDVEPFESFYEEVDKTRPDLVVPKIFKDIPIFRRKIRKLNPVEIGNQIKEIQKEKEILSNPHAILSERLEKTEEWSKGKRVLKRKKSFELIIPKTESNWAEKEIDFFNIFDRDEDTGEKKIYKDDGVLKKPIETQELRKEIEDNIYKYIATRDPEGGIKIIEVYSMSTSPLAKLINSPPDTDGKPLATKVFIEEDKKLHDLPILEEESERIIRTKPIDSISPLMSKEEAYQFLREVKNDPKESKVELLKETGEVLDGLPILRPSGKEEFSDDVKVQHMIELLEEEGKLETIKILRKDSDPEGVVEPTEADAVRLKEEYNGRPTYLLVEDEKKSLDGETTLDQEIDPVEELKKVLENTEKIPEAQAPYNDITKKNADSTENYQEKNKLVDRLFEEIEKAAQAKGQQFEDTIFTPNSSSMVNNSLKSVKPYKDMAWEKLSTVYEVTSSNY